MSLSLHDLKPVPFAFTIRTETITIVVPDTTSVEQWYKQALQLNPSTPFPYWAKVWPSAIALATFLVQNSVWVKNQHVLETGSGSGLPSFIAARWAASVCITDAVPEALEFLQLTKRHFPQKQITTGLLDWHTADTYPPADVLLLSDVNYDPRHFHAVRKLIDHYYNNGAAVILSSPHRLMAKPFIEELLAWSIHQEVFTIDATEISVFVLQKN